MANDDLKKIIDQQSVINEKLDGIDSKVTGLDEKVNGLKSDIKELDKKADVILKFAQEVDDDLQDHKKRLTRIERIPVIAHTLNE